MASFLITAAVSYVRNVPTNWNTWKCRGSYSPLVTKSRRYQNLNGTARRHLDTSTSCFSPSSPAYSPYTRNRNRTISSLATSLGYCVTLNPRSRLSTLKKPLNYKQCQAAVLRSRPFERKLAFRLLVSGQLRPGLLDIMRTYTSQVLRLFSQSKIHFEKLAHLMKRQW